MKRPLSVVQPHSLRFPLIEHLGACESWAISTYSKCDHHCVYCMTLVQGASEPRYPADEIVFQLRSELAPIPSDDIFGLGSLCDAYPHAEERFGVTRLVLAELIAQNRRFQIVTKGSTVRRDLDLIAGYPRGAVTVSLCSVDDAALRKVDPRAPSSAERLETVRLLLDAGVRVTVSASPWIPGITEARALVERVPRGTLVVFAPLNVSTSLADTAYGTRFSQQEIDRAYLAEFHAFSHRDGVTWMHPVGGAPMPSRHPFAEMSPPPVFVKP